MVLRAHEILRKALAEQGCGCSTKITFTKLDDYADRAGRLTGAIASVEGKLGSSVNR
jgi:hypothetical protein